MSAYDEVRSTLLSSPESWLVTGAAGFIGSHLVENRRLKSEVGGQIGSEL
jgi:hypothetical protein